MPRILVIDDDASVRDILHRVLTGRGYEVSAATDGAEGIRHFREHGADLVVTDLLMPGKEGLETIRELRREFPDVKIIVMSGGGGLGDPSTILLTARTFGASYSFQKPIPRDDFLAAVRELVGPSEGDDPGTASALPGRKP